jgi:hypothetical protein
MGLAEAAVIGDFFRRLVVGGLPVETVHAYGVELGPVGRGAIVALTPRLQLEALLDLSGGAVGRGRALREVFPASIGDEHARTLSWAVDGLHNSYR